MTEDMEIFAVDALPETDSFVGEVVELTEAPTDRPLLTTSFDDYSVTEGLLLLILLFLFLSSCCKLLKEGFYWL